MNDKSASRVSGFPGWLRRKLAGKTILAMLFIAICLGAPIALLVSTGVSDVTTLAVLAGLGAFAFAVLLAFVVFLNQRLRSHLDATWTARMDSLQTERDAVATALDALKSRYGDEQVALSRRLDLLSDEFRGLSSASAPARDPASAVEITRPSPLSTGDWVDAIANKISDLERQITRTARSAGHWGNDFVEEEFGHLRTPLARHFVVVSRPAQVVSFHSAMKTARLDPSTVVIILHESFSDERTRLRISRLAQGFGFSMERYMRSAAPSAFETVGARSLWLSRAQPLGYINDAVKKYRPDRVYEYFDGLVSPLVIRETIDHLEGHSSSSKLRDKSRENILAVQPRLRFLPEYVDLSPLTGIVPISEIVRIPSSRIRESFEEYETFEAEVHGGMQPNLAAAEQDGKSVLLATGLLAEDWGQYRQLQRNNPNVRRLTEDDEMHLYSDALNTMAKVRKHIFISVHPRTAHTKVLKIRALAEAYGAQILPHNYLAELLLLKLNAEVVGPASTLHLNAVHALGRKALMFSVPLLEKQFGEAADDNDLGRATTELCLRSQIPAVDDLQALQQWLAQEKPIAGSRPELVRTASA